MDNFLWRLLPLLISNLTPIIFDEIEKFIEMLRQKASKTPNPYDDVFVELLDRIVNPQ